MRPLLALIATTALLLAGCQTETSTGPAVEQVKAPMEEKAPASTTESQASSDTQTSGKEEAPTTGSSLAPATQGHGLKAYIDPETGELTTPPEDVRIPPEAQTDTREVREEEPPELIPLEGGGYRAPLGDRFKVYSGSDVPAEDAPDEQK